MVRVAKQTWESFEFNLAPTCAFSDLTLRTSQLRNRPYPEPLECMRLIPLLRKWVESGALDNARVEPLPLKKIVFAAFREDLRFLDRDLLQKVLVFYQRLDEADHYLGLSREFSLPGFGRTTASAALESIGQAYIEGQQLLKALLPKSKAWGKHRIVRPEQLKLKAEQQS